jgi:hypothetical protein
MRLCSRWVNGFVGLAALLTLTAAHAQNPIVEMTSRPTVVLPSRGAFEEILFFYARQPQLAWGKAGNTQVPRLNMGLSSQGNLFVTRDLAKPEAAMELLGLQTLDVRISDLPGGRFLRPLLGEPEAGVPDRMTVRDLGPVLRGPQGPLRSVIRAVLGDSQVAQVIGGGVAAAAILGAVGQMGSQRAGALGFAPTFSHSLWEGRIRTLATLNTEAKFKNAMLDASVAFKLPRVFETALSREDFVEVGMVGWRSPENEVFVNSKWAKLRTRTRLFEVAFGVRSNRNEQSVWTEGEVFTQVQKFGLRSTLMRQMATGHTQVSSAVTLQGPSTAVGLFAMVDGNLSRSAGLLTMGTF